MVVAAAAFPPPLTGRGVVAGRAVAGATLWRLAAAVHEGDVIILVGSVPP